jgi:methionyl-tRNA formyltransferase
LIRASDPAPGAWTTLAGKKVQLFGATKQLTRTFGDVQGKPGEVVAIGESITISAQGGQISVTKLKHEDGKKVSAADFLTAHGISVGARFGE